MTARTVLADEERVASFEWAEIVTIVRRQMRSFVGTDRDLEDLTQIALEKIYKNAHRFEGRSQISTYTYSVCARTALNHWRWYKRWLRRFERATDATPEPAAPNCDAVASVLEGERLQKLHRALERLSPIKRAVVTLCELEEIPAAQVAEILECPEATVRSRLRQARIDLATLLTEEEAR